MPADPQLARDLFLHAVGKLPPEQWGPYVAEACGPDIELKQHVLRLLQVHREAGSFLERPAQGVGATCAFTPAPEDVTAVAPAEAAGTTIGPYRLLEEVGEGGMGTVWMAQQLEPVKRLVALKLVKPGMDSRQVIARFEQERQALALMDHPNIARVLDAGTTEGGRPYFVMELVKGMPITRYCDEHRLSPRQRLELFVPVCQAVQHAHQKGIIHRDLKPSNVLVCVYDGRPVPKVIDFGIAKATGPQLTEHTLVTGFGTVVGTLEYMSPEQAELDPLDIDTRSDIYSLGVMLYELLTGTTPLDRARLKKGALLEVLRLIREEEPPRPSTRLSTAEGLPNIAANRGLEPKKLSGMVRGELDWLVMKALEKDRTRRYATANGLASDVQRYLADEPVQACPPSAGYRLRKFARRNRTALTATGLVLFLIALLGGGGGWILRDRAARRLQAANDLELALERAELYQGEGKRAEALAALERAELLVTQASEDPVRDQRLADLKERLDAEARDQEFVARYEDIRLRVQSEVNTEESRFTQEAASPEIRDALRQYGILLGELEPAQAAARIQDRPERVRRHLIAALDECLKQTSKADAPARQWLLATLEGVDADAWRVRARKAVAERDGKALEQLALEADVGEQSPGSLLLVASSLPASMRPTRLELMRRIQRAYPADLWANVLLAMELQENGRAAEAVRYHTAALALRPDNPGIYVNRGGILHRAGESDAAVADYRRAIALAPGYAVPHLNLGTVLHDRGQLAEAIAEFHKAIELKNDYARAHYGLGNALRDSGRLAEAIAAFREAIRIKPDYPQAHTNLGLVLLDSGQVDEAIAEFQSALRTRQSFLERGNALAGLKDARWAKNSADTASAPPRNAKDVRVPSPVALLLNPVMKRDQYRYFTATGLRLPYVYAMDRVGDLWVFKLPAEAETNAGPKLQEVGHILAAGDGSALVVIGDTLLCSRKSCLEVYSLEEPDRPRPLGKFGPKYPSQVTYALVRWQDRLIRVGTGDLSVFDVSHPATPLLLGTTKIPGAFVAGGVVRDRLFVAETHNALPKDGRHGIAVYDLSNPRALKEIGFAETPGEPCEVLPIGPDHLAVPLRGRKVQLFRLADPLKPVALVQPAVTDLSAPEGGVVSPIDGKNYLITGNAVFYLEKDALIPVGRLRYQVGFMNGLIGGHGCSAGDYAVLLAGEAVVLRAQAASAARLDPPGEPVPAVRAGKPVRVGQELDLAGPTAAGGKLDLKQLRGKVVLIDFWASWCHPCLAEMPNVKSVYDRYHEDGFEVIGVSLDHSREALTKFLKTRNLPWPQLFFEGKGEQGWDNPLVRRYGIKSIPYTILVGPEGKVVQIDVRGEALGPAVAKLLGKRPAPSK